MNESEEQKDIEQYIASHKLKLLKYRELLEIGKAHP